MLRKNNNVTIDENKFRQSFLEQIVLSQNISLLFFYKM